MAQMGEISALPVSLFTHSNKSGGGVGLACIRDVRVRVSKEFQQSTQNERKDRTGE